MGKIFVITIGLLLLTLLSFLGSKDTSAQRPGQPSTASCSSVGISYVPNSFVENPGQITLNFTVSNPNTLNTLNGKRVWIHYGGLGPVPVIGVVGPGQYYVESNRYSVDRNTFSLTLDNDQVETRDSHSASFWWESNPGQEGEFCSQINYTVGAGNACGFDSETPRQIPPNSLPLDIRFGGAAERDYRLVRVTPATVLSNARTDRHGQGTFNSVVLTGPNGDRFQLRIEVSSGGTSGAGSCFHPIEIISSAPRPSPLPSPAPGVPSPTLPPVIPGPGGTGSVPTATPCTGPNCSTAGGIPCGDASNPGFKTAIGCVRTTPLGFIEDLLKFITAIGGGLAFLMMLLGAFQMLTSAGNPETLATGKDRFTNAIIGLLFVIFAVLLMQIIGFDILRIPGFAR